MEFLMQILPLLVLGGVVFLFISGRKRAQAKENQYIELCQKMQKNILLTNAHSIEQKHEILGIVNSEGKTYYEALYQLLIRIEKMEASGAIALAINTLSESAMIDGTTYGGSTKYHLTATAIRINKQ